MIQALQLFIVLFVLILGVYELMLLSGFGQNIKKEIDSLIRSKN